MYLSCFRTRTTCDLYVLTKKDLDEVVTCYPLIRKKIMETAEERQRMAAERDKAIATNTEEDKIREDVNKLKVFSCSSFCIPPGTVLLQQSTCS